MTAEIHVPTTARRTAAWRRRWVHLAAPLIALTVLAIANGARLKAAPSPTPRLDWLFDGSVATTARIGNTLYVGG